MSDKYIVPVITAEEFQDRGQVEILTRLSSELLSLLQQTNPLMAQYIEQIRNQAASQSGQVAAETAAMRLRGQGQVFVGKYKATNDPVERKALLATLPVPSEPRGDASQIKNYLLRQATSGVVSNPASLTFLDSIARVGDQKKLVEQLGDENLKNLTPGIYTNNQPDAVALESFSFTFTDTHGIRHYVSLTKTPDDFIVEHQILLSAEKSWVLDAAMEYLNLAELSAAYPRVKGLEDFSAAARMKITQLYLHLEQDYEQSDNREDEIVFPGIVLSFNPEDGKVAVTVNGSDIEAYDYASQITYVDQIMELFDNRGAPKTDESPGAEV